MQSVLLDHGLDSLDSIEISMQVSINTLLIYSNLNFQNYT
jgi:hypothetical protein